MPPRGSRAPRGRSTQARVGHVPRRANRCERDTQASRWRGHHQLAGRTWPRVAFPKSQTCAKCTQRGEPETSRNTRATLWRAWECDRHVVQHHQRRFNDHAANWRQRLGPESHSAAAAAAWRARLSYDLMPPDDFLREFLGDLFEQVTFVSGDVTDLEQLQAAATSMVSARSSTQRPSRRAWRANSTSRSASSTSTSAAQSTRWRSRARCRFRALRLHRVGRRLGQRPQPPELDEDSPSRATNLYGITKHTAERVVTRYGELTGMDVVTMRPANVYGPMERLTPDTRARPSCARCCVSSRRATSCGSTAWRGPTATGPSWRISPKASSAPGRAQPAAPGLHHDLRPALSIGDMLAAFQRAWPDIRYRVVPQREANYVASGDRPGPRPANARIQQDFGWAPSTPLDDGVKLYLLGFARHGPQ